MEIIVLQGELTKPQISFREADLAQLGKEIGDAPEGYVFLLTPEEWSEWLKLYATLSKAWVSTKTLDARREILSDFTEKNASNPLSLICVLSTHPKISGIYKFGNLTKSALGDCYAIFFAKEEQLVERSEGVKKAIFQFRKDQLKKPPLS